MRRGPVLTLAGAAMVYAVITLTYALSVPVGSSADELSHLNYARVVADHAALPGATVPERQQPPLYYLLSAGLLRLGAAPVALRLLSIVLGVVTIVCIALGVRRLLPNRPWLWAGAAAAMALLPGFQFVSASITDDSVATAAAAAVLLVATHVALAPRPSRGLLLAAGCSVGVALLAKETDMPVIVALAVVVAWRWGRRLAVADVALAALPVVAIAGWWYARNLVAFHRPLPPLTPIGVGPNKLRTAAQLRSFVTQSLRGLFSPERYQGSPLTLPLAGRALIVLLIVVLAVLLAAAVVFASRSWARWDGPRRAVVAADTVALAGAAVLSLANAVLVVFQPQGRYLLVGATGPLAALVWAIQRVGRRRAAVTVLASTCAAAGVAVSVFGLTTAIAGAG